MSGDQYPSIFSRQIEAIVVTCLRVRVVSYFDKPARARQNIQTTSENIKRYCTPKNLTLQEIYYPTAIVNKIISERGRV